VTTTNKRMSPFAPFTWPLLQAPEGKGAACSSVLGEGAVLPGTDVPSVLPLAPALSALRSPAADVPRDVQNGV
jgi:hypothetical protein